MEIKNTNFSDVPLAGRDKVSSTNESADAKSPVTGRHVAPWPGYIPSPELLTLMDLLRSQSEVRTDEIRRVAAKLADGSYNSPDSIAKTSEAFLSAE